MNENKDGIGIDRISSLPECIIHHILSLLQSPVDVAKASVLSKTWFRLWITLPIFDFDQTRFRYRDKFLKFVGNSLLRCQQNEDFVIMKLRLFITSLENSGTAPLVDKWIGLAIEKKVKELEVHMPTPVSRFKESCYSLPPTLSSVKSLKILRLRSCKIEPFVMQGVKYNSLQKVSLECLHIDTHMMKGMISSCPFLEELFFKHCWGFQKLHISGLHMLKTLVVHLERNKSGTIDVQAPNLCCFELTNGTKTDMPCMSAFQNLRTLCLYNSEVKSRWFNESISNFRLLEELHLYAFYMSKSIEFSSCSLRRLSIEECKVEVKIDAPNLLSFSYEGHEIPYLLSASVSCKSKVRLGLFDHEDIETCWFRNLSDFCSKINHLELLDLNIKFGKYAVDREELRQVQFPPSHTLDHLILRIDSLKSYYPALIDRWSSNYPALIDGLFWRCQPQAISLELNDYLLNFKYKDNFIKYLYQKLMHGEDRAKNLRHYVKDVGIEICDGRKGKSRPIQLDSLLDALPTLSKGQVICFKSNTCFEMRKCSKRK